MSPPVPGLKDRAQIMTPSVHWDMRGALSSILSLQGPAAGEGIWSPGYTWDRSWLLRSMWLPQPLTLEYPKTSQSPPCSHRDTACPQSPPVQGSLGDSSVHLTRGHGSRTAPATSLCRPQALPSPEGSGIRPGPRRSFVGPGTPQDFALGHPEGQPGITPAQAPPAQPRGAGEKDRVRAALEDTGACWEILAHAGVY